MNHLTLLPTKRTNKLFLDKYRYKVVLITKFAPMFRNKDISLIISKIQSWKNVDKFPPYIYGGHKADYDIGLNIANTINSSSAEYKVMVSSPWISFYTDSETDFNIVTKTLKNHIRYISMPSVKDPVLEKIPLASILSKILTSFRKKEPVIFKEPVRLPDPLK